MAKKKSVDIAARNAAIQDIKEELHKQGKIFLLFRRELNPVMDSIVAEYEEQQQGR